ncbi:MAG: hypothetical protein ACFCUG_08595 [Thiotrichales bacterium]
MIAVPPEFPAGLRLLLAHKQNTSARLRFLRFAHGILAFAPLPALASVLDEPPSAPTVVHHPAQYLRAAECWFELPPASLKLEPEFRARVDTSAGTVEIRLAHFTATDPPFASAAARSARFIAITEARGCTPVELDLLRQAYETLIG